MNFDEELQNRIEKGIHSEDSLDEKAYQRIFDVLKKEPYHLPSGFADQIITRVEARGSSLFKDYFWFGLGMLSFIVATVFVIVRNNIKIDFGSSKFISGYWGLIAFGAIFILLIHFIDKKLVKDKWNSNTPLDSGS